LPVYANFIEGEVLFSINPIGCFGTASDNIYPETFGINPKCECRVINRKPIDRVCPDKCRLSPENVLKPGRLSGV
jgi:hypothetical protein